MVDAGEIRELQDGWTIRWHGVAEGSGQAAGWKARTSIAAAEAGEFRSHVQQNHRANFDLWHEEDKARDPAATDGEIARVKRSIDGLNQRRNDVVETLDELLLRGAPKAGEGVPMHSETPGMMIDRMSILALKIFHTREQVERSGSTEAHRLRNRARMEVLEEQRDDLTRCLEELWREVMRGDLRFKVYRQMKMYNDPDLNPAIYGSPRSAR